MPYLIKGSDKCYPDVMQTRRRLYFQLLSFNSRSIHKFTHSQRIKSDNYRTNVSWPW